MKTARVQIEIPPNRTAIVTEIVFVVVPGIFKVTAELYVPGSDGKTRGMVGAVRQRTGTGADLGAAMQECAEALLLR